MVDKINMELPMATNARLLLLSFICIALSAAEIKNTTVFNRDNTGKSIPRFANGYAIFYDREAESVSWFLLDGTPRGQVKLSLPETSRINIVDVCARADGTIAVSATALSQDSDDD